MQGSTSGELLQGAGRGLLLQLALAAPLLSHDPEASCPASTLKHIYSQGSTLGELLQGAGLGVLLQLALAAPFLLHDPVAYLRRAFELTRVFQHTWSVNLKFLPEHVFLDPWLATGLLAAHLAAVWLFARHAPC